MSRSAPRCVLVSHFHWDREWYRPFEAYRARLVDAIDRLLAILATDPGYRFVLDGQAIVLEDYLAVRPARQPELARAIRDRRVAVGPWYVQPDSLLPSGEAHVRNLLHGRRVARAFGPVSTVGYVPDSFGHPAQLPQLLAGFGISSFVYWRGNGDEIDEIGSAYRWVAPDGSAVDAVLLREGYFNAACLPPDPTEAARRLADVVARLAEGHDGPVLLMNGFDHMPPDAHTGSVAQALAGLIGGPVERGLLDDAVALVPTVASSFRGELVAGRLNNLLPGVWSARMPLKLRNRRCELLLLGWAEPWAAFARVLGAPDEQPSLRLAWQSVLQNQAHDSLCGCALDAVAERVATRFEDAEGLAAETVTRLLERVAGLGPVRQVPWSVEQEVAVFNPSPHPRTDVVRVALDGYPAMQLPVGIPEFAPLLTAAADPPGFLVDGEPARVVASPDAARVRWLPGQQPFDLEFVARDVPAFGYRRVRVTPAARVAEEIDGGREIETDRVVVAVADDGTVTIGLDGVRYPGLLAVEDRGDRGDTYDFDAVGDDPGATLVSVSWRRWRHPAGLAGLDVDRIFDLPRALDQSRERRSTDRSRVALSVAVRVARAVPRVEVGIRLNNTAYDHRLRLLLPTGRAIHTFHAATTFDVAERATALRDAARWIHPAPVTFVHQGWVSAGGLMVVAPGLPEVEVTPDGVIAVTLLRAVGWLARYDLRSRPAPAGPAMMVPGAQLQGILAASLSLLAGVDPADARDAELAFRGTIAGPEPLIAAGIPLLTVEPRALVLEACKPAEDGRGIVVRLLNPTNTPLTAVLRPGVPIDAARPVRLDEEPAPHDVVVDGDGVRFAVPAHALRSVVLVARPPRVLADVR